MEAKVYSFLFPWGRRKETKEKAKNVLARRPAVGFPEHFTKLATLKHRSVLCSGNPTSSKDLLVRNVLN